MGQFQPLKRGFYGNLMLDRNNLIDTKMYFYVKINNKGRN